MIIKNITIENFQSYHESQTMDFSNGLNLIIGNGGKGKSNYLMPFIGCYSVRYISLGLVGVQLTVCHNQQNLQCSVMSSSIKELYLKHK